MRNDERRQRLRFVFQGVLFWGIVLGAGYIIVRVLLGLFL